MRCIAISALVAALLSTLAGCSREARPSETPHSSAAQVSVARVAQAAPPTDFEFEFAPTETSEPQRFTKDAPLEGSLKADRSAHGKLSDQ